MSVRVYMCVCSVGAGSLGLHSSNVEPNAEDSQVGQPPVRCVPLASLLLSALIVAAMLCMMAPSGELSRCQAPHILRRIDPAAPACASHRATCAPPALPSHA